MEIFSGEPGTPGTHELFDVATGELVERVEEPGDEKQLAQWAKGAMQLAMQLAIESVPENDRLAQERKEWITKVLYEISKIRPGMTRFVEGFYDRGQFVNASATNLCVRGMPVH